jgi:hypothetical protein
MERPNFSKIFHSTVGVGIAQVRENMAQRHLSALNGNEILVSDEIPVYISQLANADPSKIEKFYGRISDADAAKRFGAKDIDEFSYWAWRSCGIAGVQMVLSTKLGESFNKKTMDLVKEGLEFGGYDVENDVGWYHTALSHLSEKYRISSEVRKFVPPSEIALEIAQNKYILASMKSKNGGHLLLLYGVKVAKSGGLQGFFVHDPNNYQSEGESKFIEIDDFKKLYTRRIIIFD